MSSAPAVHQQVFAGDAVHFAACFSGDGFDSGALQIRKCGRGAADAQENFTIDFSCPDSAAAGHTALAPLSDGKAVREIIAENNEQ